MTDITASLVVNTVISELNDRLGKFVQIDLTKQTHLFELNKVINDMVTDEFIRNVMHETISDILAKNQAEEE